MANGQNLRIEQETPQPQTPQQPASLPRPLGGFILISIDLLAFTNDVKEMLAGKRRSVRFRVLP